MIPKVTAKQVHELRPGDGPVIVVRSEAMGALRNGTRVRKVVSEPGDTNTIGTLGIIVGSLGPMPAGEKLAGHFAYFVCWDPRPDAPALTIDFKIEPVPAQS